MIAVAAVIASVAFAALVGWHILRGIVEWWNL